MRRDPGSGVFQADFRVGGRRVRRSLHTKDEREAAERERALLALIPSRLDLETPWGLEVARAAADGTSWLRQMYAQAMRRDRNRGRPSELTMEELVWLAHGSNGRCALSGVPFFTRSGSRAVRQPYAPSLDRIDPGSAYAIENCRLVCVAVNIALGEWGDDVLRRVAYGVVQREQMDRWDQSGIGRGKMSPGQKSRGALQVVD